MHTFYYTPLCPQCPPFEAILKEKGIPYQAVNITESIANLKAFIRLRDTQSEFDGIKEHGFVGIPLFVTDSQQFIWNAAELDRL